MSTERAPDWFFHVKRGPKPDPERNDNMTQPIRGNTLIAAANQSKELDLSTLVLMGDLSSLSPDQKLTYYIQRCKQHGLDPASKPFDYFKLQGREVLYANKGCAEQLRSIHKISVKITKADQVGDIFVVIAEGKSNDGREDSATGAVSISGLKGEALANAMMKAETKAKRRLTLSICGLNMLDETEVESIQADQRLIKPEQPTAMDGHQTDRGYRIDFGKWNMRSLEEVYNNEGPDAIEGYITYLENQANKNNKPLNANAVKFISEAEQFLGAMENKVTEEDIPF